MENIEQYAQRIHLYDEAVPPMLEMLLHERPWKTLADLGCGDGALLGSLRARGALDGKRAIGVDLSRSRIERVRALNPGIETHVSSAQKVDAIADGAVDLLVSTQVIEHVPDDHEMLREMARILAPGGRAYLSTVFKKPYAWYFHRCNGKWALDPTHIREYSSEAELVPWIEKAGFRILKQDKRLFVYSLLDFALKRVGASHEVYTNPVLRALRKLGIPIIGYYNWEFVLERVPQGQA